MSNEKQRPSAGEIAAALAKLPDRVRAEHEALKRELSEKSEASALPQIPLDEAWAQSYRLPEAPKPCAFPHCPATAAIGDIYCNDCRRQAPPGTLADLQRDEPEHRDADTPLREDQDRLDWEERSGQ